MGKEEEKPKSAPRRIDALAGKNAGRMPAGKGAWKHRIRNDMYLFGRRKC